MFCSTRELPRDVHFHETCTLHDTTNRGPRKHATGMNCSIAVVPRVITRVKMKLQLSGTVVQRQVAFLLSVYQGILFQKETNVTSNNSILWVTCFI